MKIQHEIFYGAHEKKFGVMFDMPVKIFFVKNLIVEKFVSFSTKILP